MTGPGAALGGVLWFALGYFFLLNTGYLALLVVAARGAIAEVRRAPFTGHENIFHSPLAPPITIVVPARDCEDSIVVCVRGLLHLRYPDFEVVVVDDGSTDQTFERLREAFELVEIPRAMRDDVPTVGDVIASYAPQNRDHLLVVRKDYVACPADAANVGINAALYPLVCRIDAGAYLDDDLLVALAKPFIEDPVHVVAVAAAVRVAGRAIKGRPLLDARMPRHWLPRIQAVEHLRSFLIGGAAWSRMQAMLFASGAFGLFRRATLVQIGGFDVRSHDGDRELVTRLHHELRRSGRPYKLAFVANPCCWTRVPSNYTALARQRRRSAQGLAQTIRIHRAMFVNPRYGSMGLVVLPYHLVFELLGALVEVVAVPVLVSGYVLGYIDLTLAVLFLIVSLGYATFLSILALVVDELFYHRYRRWRDLALIVFAAVVENLGYRQLNAWWRFRGVLAALLPRPGVRVPEPARALAPSMPIA